MCLAILFNLKYALYAKRIFVSWCNALKVTTQMCYNLLFFLLNEDNLANEELQGFFIQSYKQNFCCILSYCIQELYSGGGNADGTTCLKNWTVISIDARSRFSFCASQETETARHVRQRVQLSSMSVLINIQHNRYMSFNGWRVFFFMSAMTLWETSRVSEYKIKSLNRK